VRGEEVLLVRLTYTSGWHLPGGGVERRECFRTAWIRELAEECGLEALDAELFGLYHSTRYGKTDHVAIYLTRAYREIPGAKRDPEIAEMKFFKFDEIPKDTTPATKRRIAEHFGLGEKSSAW
jgi:ADP-ribose pyrophosphatase YjhB (NUDIX family)